MTTKIELNVKQTHRAIPEKIRSVDSCRLFIAKCDNQRERVFMRLRDEYCGFEDNCIRWGDCDDVEQFKFIRYLTPEESIKIHGEMQ